VPEIGAGQWPADEVKAAADRFKADDPSMFSLVTALHGKDVSPWLLFQLGYLTAENQSKGRFDPTA
jgi:hypothetical protein